MADCPDDRTLELLLSERLAPADEQVLERHLGGCRTCRVRLDSLMADRYGEAEVRAAVRPADDTPWTEVPGLFAAGETQRPADGPEPLPQLPGYEIEEVIGRGGMGVVYRARQVGLNRIVALKMVVSIPSRIEDQRRRFRREAEMLAKLRHPNIVPVYEIGGWRPPAGGPEIPFFSMEWMRAGSLARYARGPMRPIAVAELVCTLAGAVSAAHAVGIIHRDLKPANVLLDWPADPPADPPRVASAADDFDPRRFCVKISDFGLAKDDDPAASLESGFLVGTPAYMAPEQARGEACGPVTDVYALGVMMYQLLTGRVPFVGRTAWDTLIVVQIRPLTPPSRHRPDVPRDLEAICVKCLNKQPLERYPSGDALADDLTRYLEGRPVIARSAGMAERAVKWIRRNPVLGGVAAAGVGSLAAGVVGTSIALVHANAGWREAIDQTTKVRAALGEVTRQRDRGDEYRASALQSLSEYWTLLAQEPRLETADLAPLRRSLLQRAASTYEKLIRTDPADARLARTRLSALTQLAKLRLFLGELTECADNARSAIALARQLRAAAPADVELVRQEALACSLAGEVWDSLGRPDEAGRMFDDGIAAADAIDPIGRDSMPLIAALADLYFGRSTHRGQHGDYAGAIADLQAAVARYERAAAVGMSANDVTYKMATCHFTHGVYLSEMPDRRAEADWEFGRAAEGFARLRLADANDVDVAERWAMCRRNRGINRMGMGQYEAAIEELQSAQSVFAEWAAKKPSRFILRFYAGGTLAELGSCLHQLGRTGEAENYFDRSAEILETLRAEMPRATFIAQDLGNLYRNRGWLRMDVDDPLAAADWFQKAVDTLAPILKMEPHNPIVQRYIENSKSGLKKASAMKPDG